MNINLMHCIEEITFLINCIPNLIIQSIFNWILDQYHKIKMCL